MDCQDNRRLMNDYVDGLLTENDVALFEGHMLRCQSCRLDLAAEKCADDLLSSQEFAGLSADFTARVLVRYRQKRRGAANLKWSALTSAGYGLSAVTLVAALAHFLRTSAVSGWSWLSTAVDALAGQVDVVTGIAMGVESSLVLLVAILIVLTWGLYCERSLGYSN